MFWVRFILIAAATFVLVLKCAAVSDLSVKGVVEFNAAYQAWDGVRFEKAARLLQEAAAETPGSVTNFYWLGVARFHRMLHLQNGPGSQTSQAAASAALDSAVEALTAAVKLDDRHAESHALLGTLYGMKINGSLIRAARFGPRVSKHSEKALEHGASNPRVQYLLGMCQMHTANNPGKWRAALQTLLTAEKLFEAEQKSTAAPLNPRWGYDSCLTFIGRTYELLADRKNAAVYYRKTLAIHPADHLAQEGLTRLSGRP
jgi:tetratricopeptide (TPR) repeat protein